RSIVLETFFGLRLMVLTSVRPLPVRSNPSPSNVIELTIRLGMLLLLVFCWLPEKTRSMPLVGMPADQLAAVFQFASPPRPTQVSVLLGTTRSSSASRCNRRLGRRRWVLTRGERKNERSQRDQVNGAIGPP